MARSHDQDQFVQHAAGQTLLARSERVSAHHAEVQLVGAHLLLDHARVGDAQVDRDRRLLALEGAHEGGHEV